MRQYFPLGLFLCVLLCLTIPPRLLASGTQVSEHDKIQYLLQEIDQSNAIFIRNEKQYKAHEAHDHLKFKLSKATKMFLFFGPQKELSAQDFIHKIASKSSASNEDYFIQFPEQAPQRLGEWLQLRLKAFEKQAPTPQKPIPAPAKTTN